MEYMPLEVNQSIILVDIMVVMSLDNYDNLNWLWISIVGLLICSLQQTYTWFGFAIFWLFTYLMKRAKQWTQYNIFCIQCCVCFQNQPTYLFRYCWASNDWTSPVVTFSTVMLCPLSDMLLYYLHLQQIDSRHYILVSRSIIHLSLLYTWWINSQIWQHQNWQRWRFSLWEHAFIFYSQCLIFLSCCS